MTVDSNGTEFCNLATFANNMRLAHGPLSLLVCIFGSIANIFNICVLTTREMRIPTNFILTGLAVSDLLVMLEYIPFTSHVYLNSAALIEADYFSYPWAVYMYFHAVFTQVCHFNSCCLTVILAVWRYIAINKPQINKIMCNPYRTKLAIFASSVLCPFVCTPIIMALHIKSIDKHVHPNGTIIVDKYVTNETSNLTKMIYLLDIKQEYAQVNFLIYSVVLKLIPCILLTILSVLLIMSLWDAKKRWKNLSNSSGVPLVKTSDQQRKDCEKEQQVDRTTRMLLVVLLLFLLPEFPQATMGLLSAILPISFQTNCYIKLGDLFDIMALVSSSVTFILYCSMSAQFRKAFQEMFKLNIIADFVKQHWRRADAEDGEGAGKLSPNHVTELTVFDQQVKNEKNKVSKVAKSQTVNVEANIPDSAGVRV